MMELYKRYPKVCTVWAFMEVVLFAGVIFGWGSLVYILKEEGFYLEACTGESMGDLGQQKHVPSLHSEDVISTSNATLVPTPQAARNASSGYATVTTTDELSNNRHPNNNSTSGGCQAQEAKLNLWFSMAVSFMYLSFTGIGYLIRLVGTRVTRCLFLLVYMAGTLCLAFASPEMPWLLLPALCFIGTGGLTLLATNLQVAELHPHVRSTVIAIFTGLFDFSSINKQIIRIAFEGGIPRRSSYLFITALFGVIVGISTFLFLPRRQICVIHLDEIKRRRMSRPDNTLGNNPGKHQGNHRDSDVDNEADKYLLQRQTTTADENRQTENGALDRESAVDGSTTKQPSAGASASLATSLLSVTFIFHLIWLFVHALRFVTFIGLLNVWLEKIFHENEDKVGDMLAVFSYITMGAILSALLCGFIYDYQRKRYIGAGDVKRVYVPVVLPMVLVILVSIGVTVSCLFKQTLAPYFAFTFFTFFRSSLFTVAVAFVGDAFPLDHFGVLFGFIQFAAGLAGLVQYPVFQWYDSLPYSDMHVNFILLVLQVLTLAHPAILYIRGVRDHSTPANDPICREITL